MEIRAASVTGEIAIAMARADVDQLVAALTSGNARIAGGVVSSLAPYDTPVQAISITISEADKVSLSVDWALGELLVTGNRKAMQAFARDVIGLREVEPRSHYHFEHNPLDSYFAEGSAPLVIEVIA